MYVAYFVSEYLHVHMHMCHILVLQSLSLVRKICLVTLVRLVSDNGVGWLTTSTYIYTTPYIICQCFWCAVRFVFIFTLICTTYIHTYTHIYGICGMVLPAFAFAEVGCNCNKSLSDLGFI